MICQSCNQQVATVHLTEIMNQQKKEVHLCEECSRQKGISYKANISVQELFSHLSTQKTGKQTPDASPAEGEELQADLQAMTCPACGISFGEFRSTGRLGCPEDYRHFKQGLTQLLEKIHGAAQHVGKAPGEVREPPAGSDKIKKLRQELDQAIQQEEYEQAAQLRDSIQNLESDALVGDAILDYEPDESQGTEE